MVRIRSEKGYYERISMTIFHTKCMLCDYDIPMAIDKHHVSFTSELTVTLCRNCHSIVTLWLNREKPHSAFNQYLKDANKNLTDKVNRIISLYQIAVNNLKSSGKIKSIEQSPHQIRTNTRTYQAQETIFNLMQPENDYSFGFLVENCCNGNGIDRNIINNTLYKLCQQGRLTRPRYGFYRKVVF